MTSAELKTPKEMASQSGWPERRIRNLLAEGELKHVRIGSHYLLPVDAIDEFLERKMFRPSGAQPLPEEQG
jgi:excisionase family DNA binding protein